ncbi:metal ABC transporter permease [candidate division WOR-3 bacterium]|uniref:Metal ABC transporter permease n=1 Tax=candidate division WOR-3 bacterium TaxID=2052148 RepID=A0A937XDU5_UNCW3|nr:metal ABC transporter permease [candidate division WOR-3 bacterium]
MFDFLHYGFMQRALLSSLIVGTTCSFIGVFVVLRGMAFAGSGLAHAAFGGVALGFLLAINPLFAAVLFCLGTAGLIQVAGRRAQLRMDAAIGIFFAFAMALGVLFMGLMKRYDARVYGYLFGNVLGVTAGNLVLMAVLGLVVIGAIGFLYRQLKFLTFDEEMAEASGLPTGFLAALLLALLALTVVVSLKTVGMILVEALLVTPAATAYQLTYRYGMMFVLSWIASVASCVAGIVISYALGIPSGAAIVIVATLLFALAALFSPKRRKCRVCGLESTS